MWTERRIVTGAVSKLRDLVCGGGGGGGGSRE